MILISDSGSTKADWALKEGDNLLFRIKTQGLNPAQQSSDVISQILNDELKPQLQEQQPETVYFYGAGCAYHEANERIKKSLQLLFPNSDIHIFSDLLAAARALCGSEEGIACILGTGSNSCLFDGKQIVDNTPSLGYILGDEGGGAFLGRRLISDCLKKQLSNEICEKFFMQYNLNLPMILERVYHQPMPNSFLASFTPFLLENRKHPEIKNLLILCFRSFFKRNTMVYKRPWLPVHIIGGVAISFSDEIREAAEGLSLSIGTIVQSPLNGLINFHK